MVVGVTLLWRRLTVTAIGSRSVAPSRLLVAAVEVLWRLSMIIRQLHAVCQQGNASMEVGSWSGGIGTYCC